MHEDPSYQTSQPAILRIGVVGAGFMGSGIAQSAASAGIEVIVYEPEEGPLARSRELLAGSVEQAVQRGKTSREDADSLVQRITYTTELDDFGSVDAVIEAVSEDLHLKQRLFRELDTRLPDLTFLASNTSSVPVAQLAAHTRRPARVLGLHFFSPVPVMKLVEIVVTLDTSSETLAAARAFATTLGKTPVESKDRSGFVVNMLLVPYLMAAVRMLEQGFATRDDIDVAMQLGCGHPMGPLTLSDFIGLDVLHAIGVSLYDEFRREEYASPPLLKRMVAAGRLGRKSGRGFYEYAAETSLTGAVS